MVQLRKKGFFAPRDALEKDGQSLGELKYSRIDWVGEAVVDGHALEMEDVGGMVRRDYVLRDGGEQIFEVQQSGVLRKLSFHFEGRDFELANKNRPSAWILIRSGDEVVGSLRGRGFLVSRVEIDLPDCLSLPVQTFLGWMGLVIWSTRGRGV